MSQVLAAFNQMGPQKFGEMVCQMAPYFSTINPEFIDLRAGHSEAKVTKCRAVENHLGTVHAIVMCNAAELVGGTLV